MDLLQLWEIIQKMYKTSYWKSQRVTTGPWHFYIATVQTDEAMNVERLLKNMAAPSNSQGLAVHKYDKKGTVAIEAI